MKDGNNAVFAARLREIRRDKLKNGLFFLSFQIFV